jgi:peptidoglycan/LPS O-acetylase OafA/YrhL
MSLDWGSHEVVWMLGFLAASAFILAVVLTPRRMTTRLLESRPLRWLGRISYSLYMGHALVLYVARHSIHILLGPRSDSPLWGGLYCAATVVAVVVFGWLVFRFVEFPAHNWVRAISARNSLPARPAIL